MLCLTLFYRTVNVVVADDLIKIRIGLNKHTAALLGKCNTGGIFTMNAINEKVNIFTLKRLVDHKLQCAVADTTMTILLV